MEPQENLKAKRKTNGGNQGIGKGVFYDNDDETPGYTCVDDISKRQGDDVDFCDTNNRSGNQGQSSCQGSAYSGVSNTTALNKKTEEIKVNIDESGDGVKVKMEYDDETQIVLSGSNRDDLELDLENKVSRLKSVLNKIKSLKRKERADQSGDEDTDDYDFDQPLTDRENDTSLEKQIKETPPNRGSIKAERKPRKPRRKVNPQQATKPKKPKVKRSSKKKEEKPKNDDNEKLKDSEEMFVVKIKKKGRGKPGKCEICGKTFTRATGLKEHMRIHTGENPFVCEICGTAFKMRSNLRTHFRVHTGVKPYQCDLCGKEFAHSNVLNRHRKLHSGIKAFMCDVCGKQFYQQTTLLRHALSHTGEKAFKCDVCEEGFNTRNSLIDHAKMHTDGIPYVCPICNKEFHVRSHLNEHLKVHTGKQAKTATPSVTEQTLSLDDDSEPNRCDVCFMELPNSSELLAHLRSHCYTGLDPYKCGVCEMLCTSRKKLQTHTRTHRQPGTVTCEVCDKEFMSSSYLKIHKRIHSGERPFVCETCGKSFISNSDYLRHTRVHSGDKPYQCEFCERRFSRKSHLNVHFKVHEKVPGVKSQYTKSIELLKKKVENIIAGDFAGKGHGNDGLFKLPHNTGSYAESGFNHESQDQDATHYRYSRDVSHDRDSDPTQLGTVTYDQNNEELSKLPHHTEGPYGQSEFIHGSRDQDGSHYRYSRDLSHDRDTDPAQQRTITYDQDSDQRGYARYAYII